MIYVISCNKRVEEDLLAKTAEAVDWLRNVYRGNAYLPGKGVSIYP
jgi:hypothetical protein